jgi:hypothetical protein
VKRLSLSVSFWIPFVFAALLCYPALRLPAAAGPPFFSFLPLTFMFVALAFGRLHKRTTAARAKGPVARSEPLGIHVKSTEPSPTRSTHR